MIRQKNILNLFNKLNEIAKNGSPICVCITDEYGFVLGYSQTDCSNSRAFNSARSKAYTAARMGQTTGAFHNRIVNDKLSLADFGDPLYTSIQGGVPIIDTSGKLLGGLAVAGRPSSEDELLALQCVDILLSE